MIPGTLAGIPGFPDQPDYMDMVDNFHPNMPRITMQHWIEGDDEERAMIDRNLDRARKRQERDLEDDHHRMVFGQSRLF